MAATSWQRARRIAADMDPAPPQRLGLISALGAVLAQPVAALADLPPVASARISGWAVSGVGPWSVIEPGPGPSHPRGGRPDDPSAGTAGAWTPATTGPGGAGASGGNRRGGGGPSGAGPSDGNRRGGGGPSGAGPRGGAGASGGAGPGGNGTGTGRGGAAGTGTGTGTGAGNRGTVTGGTVGSLPPWEPPVFGEPATAAGVTDRPSAGRADLPDGCAVRIAAGAPLPGGTIGVLPDAYALVENGSDGVTVLIGENGRPAPRPGMLKPGWGVADPGSSAAAGQILLQAGELVTAGTLALAAAAGVDELTVTPPATVAPILLDNDLLATGPPRRGRDRDVVAPLLSTWVMGAGGRCLPEQSGPDEATALADLLDSVGSDIIVVTGGRGPGVAPSAVPALERIRAEILVDAVDLDPGSRVVLAETRDGRRILFLPREPADAVVALALLVSPMMAALSAQLSPRWTTVMLREDSHPTERPRALPVAIEPGELADLAVAHPWQGPHGLAALAGADAIAFIDAGKGRRGDSVPVIPLPGRS